MVKDFFIIGNLDVRLNETLIVPIPKVPNPSSMLHLRLISLCNVAYKIITKITANQIKPFMDLLVDQTQRSFVLGR